MSASSRKSGALLGGVILITIGVIFLLENFYPSISFWRLMARYWPVLLILIGLKKLYDYFTWQEVPPFVDSGAKEG
jgi:hypothetical protein